MSHLVELVTERRDLFELVLQLKLELFFLLVQGLNKIKNISGTENYLWDNESNLIISQGVKQLKTQGGIPQCFKALSIVEIFFILFENYLGDHDDNI